MTLFAPKITPFLWFDSKAEEAANFYVSVFRHAKVKHVSRYSEAGKEVHGREPGSAMTVDFELEGQPFAALNGGPGVFTFSGATSFVIHCKDQEEVDHYWNSLTEGGDPAAQQCGWLKDKFGVTWQVVPDILPEMLGDADHAKADRTMKAMLKMKKFDIEALKKAHAG
jgi:predicted 3-demethylubiquinone-9 3-methyltransferase (glyoxalase superfamily)